MPKKGAYHTTSDSFNPHTQKLFMQAMAMFNVYDNSNIERFKEVCEIYNLARLTAALDNWREGLENVFRGLPGSLYSCRSSLETHGLITRVVTASASDPERSDYRDMLTPLGGSVRSLISWWEKCAELEEAGEMDYPSSVRGVQKKP